MNDSTSASSRPVVLVTGASRGIGRAIAQELAQAGYDLIVHYVRDEGGANVTATACAQHGASVRVLRFDIADRNETKAALEADIDAHGAPYGVVLNAGIARDGAFPMLSDDDWDLVLRTNLDGFYNVMSPLVMPLIRRRKPGRIITLSSVSGITGNRGQVNYSAAKAGIIGATKAMAVELASRKITVNCVAPGLIDTDMSENAPVEEMLKYIPAGRMGKPEEVAATVRFLLSPEAAYITRQVFAVNGGLC
ncbi:MAG: 3-oxoacyl-ACP reductase FabG [Gammaproteobacteria bacterium]